MSPLNHAEDTVTNPAYRRHRERLAPREEYAGSAAGPAPGFTRIAAQHGAGIVLDTGGRLTVLDPFGEQVSDFYAVSREDPSDHFSAGRTIDHGNSLYAGPGTLVYSGAGAVLAEIVEDTVGVHDLTLTPCSQVTFDLLYPQFGGAPHRSCWANLAAALAPFGVPAASIGTTFNLFMDVWSDDDGELHVDPPPTRPGDKVVLLAHRPLWVGLTACSAEKTNNGHCTPIDYRVERA